MNPITRRASMQAAVLVGLASVAFAFLVATGVAGTRPLSEYGATRAMWASAHTPDPNPKLLRGCCFLPKQSNGTDRYFAVQYGTGLFAPKGIVFQFEMSFAPSISASQARAVVRREAPPDAILVADVRKATCEIIEYRSRQLTAAIRYHTMDAELSKTALGGRYTGRVGDIIVGPTASPGGAC